MSEQHVLLLLLVIIVWILLFLPFQIQNSAVIGIDLVQNKHNIELQQTTSIDLVRSKLGAY